MPAELAEGRGRLAPCPASPNCVHSEAPDALHRIDAFRLRADVDPAAAWQAVVDLFEGDLDARPAGREGVEIARSEADYLYAVFTTPVMRYRDDVELALDRNARVIRVRSASRVGYGDMGANRDRLESIRKQLADRGLVEPAAPQEH
jgi:uncharacterized protein (DUF1499 family)